MAHGVFFARCWILFVVVVADRLSSCGIQALEHAGSVAVVCGHSCSVVCGILVPQPRMEPRFPALQDGFPNTGPPGKSPSTEFNCIPFLFKISPWKHI